MSMGTISVYVPPTATVSNEISTLNASGTGGTFFIHWSGTGGYQGLGWFWDTPNNYLQQGWINRVNSAVPFDCDKEHDTSFESFKEHVVWDNAQNLNDILGPWDDNSKLAFLKANDNVWKNCVY